MEKITDHKFKPMCPGKCESCEKDPKNPCSHYIGYEFAQCLKPKEDHA